MKGSLYNHLVYIGWIERIFQEFSQTEIEKLRDEYHNPDALISVRPGTHSRVVSRAHNLAEAIFIAPKSTKKDKKQALEYLLICLDFEKYQLDWRKYRRDHYINWLERKFLQQPAIAKYMWCEEKKKK